MTVHREIAPTDLRWRDGKYTPALVAEQTAAAALAVVDAHPLSSPEVAFMLGLRQAPALPAVIVVCDLCNLVMSSKRPLLSLAIHRRHSHKEVTT